MNLLEVRQQFRDMSGRYDLVHDDFSDNGADRYINEAVRWLDRKIDTVRAHGTCQMLVPHRNWLLQFQAARAVKQVQVNGLPVCIVSPNVVMGEIHRLRGMLPLSWPTMCAVVATQNVHKINEGFVIDSGNYLELFKELSLQPDSPEEVNTLIFSSRIPDKEGALIGIMGVFYQLPLVNDEDTNMWTRIHPMILINAAIRQTYVTSGNKAMLDIFNDSIENDIVTFGLDRVEEAIYGRGQMRSNF